MSERQLLGYLPVDSGQISIVDPAHIELVEKGDLLTDLLTVDTKIDDGNFPVFFEKDDAEGGYGKSRIIIELGEQTGKQVPKALVPAVSEGKVLKEQPKSTPPKKIIRTLETPKRPRPQETLGQRLPKHVLPRYVLTLNQQFEYEILRDSTEKFHSFRWETPPPKGMFFHYDSRSIRWIPDETQLGAYKLAYHVEHKLGEEVVPMTTKEDSMLTYKVIPSLEGWDERLWIYVNDPPMIDIELFEEQRLYRPMAGKWYKMMPVETIRGCPYKCTFCNSPDQMKLYKGLGSNFYRKKNNKKKDFEKYLQPQWSIKTLISILLFSSAVFAEFRMEQVICTTKKTPNCGAYIYNSTTGEVYFCDSEKCTEVKTPIEILVAVEEEDGKKKKKSLIPKKPKKKSLIPKKPEKKESKVPRKPKKEG